MFSFFSTDSFFLGNCWESSITSKILKSITQHCGVLCWILVRIWQSLSHIPYFTSTSSSLNTSFLLTTFFGLTWPSSGYIHSRRCCTGAVYLSIIKLLIIKLPLFKACTIGPTGRTFNTIYKEYIHAIRNNRPGTGYSRHIPDTGHT